MTWVPWQELGICKHWALAPDRCYSVKTDKICKFKHPPRDEVKRVWEFYQEKERVKKLRALKAKQQSGLRSQEVSSPPSLSLADDHDDEVGAAKYLSDEMRGSRQGDVVNQRGNGQHGNVPLANSIPNAPPSLGMIPVDGQSRDVGGKFAGSMYETFKDGTGQSGEKTTDCTGFHMHTRARTTATSWIGKRSNGKKQAPHNHELANRIKCEGRCWERLISRETAPALEIENDIIEGGEVEGEVGKSDTPPRHDAAKAGKWRRAPPSSELFTENLLAFLLPTTSPVAKLVREEDETSRLPLMGAAKRLSDGSVKHVGPHPSTLRVSAPYLTQRSIEKRLQPTGLDAQERSQAEAREDTLRLQGAAWIDNVRRALQLPIKTYMTACVYFHRFRLAHPGAEYSCVDATAAALLVACKVEDTLKKSRDILAAAYNLKASPLDQLGADDPIFESQARVVLGVERMVLEASGFDFRSRDAATLLIKLAKRLEDEREKKAVGKVAFSALTDLHRTFAPLKQTSATLALASLELALHLAAAVSPTKLVAVCDELQAMDLSEWSITREEIMETLLDALDLYTHHTTSTILGTKYSLDDFLRIRLALNKECSDSNIPRYSTVPEPSTDRPAPNGSSLQVANGHPTPVSPPQGHIITNNPNAQSGQDGVGTVRFLLNPQLAVNEKAAVSRYFVEEWEEYEEEIEVTVVQSQQQSQSEPQPQPSLHSQPQPQSQQLQGPKDREKVRERERERPVAERGKISREMDERRSTRDEKEDRERDRERDRIRDRERDRDYYERERYGRDRYGGYERDRHERRR